MATPDPEPSSPARPTPASSATAAAAHDASRLALERWRLAPNGRVRDAEARDSERVVAAAMHLWPLATAVVGPFSPLLPLVLWLAFRRSSPFVDDHGREVLNAQLTLLVLVCVPCIGWVLLIPWALVWVVALVAGAVAAAGSELFRYPATLRALR